MAGELEELKAIISVGDLAQYMDNDILLNHALAYAISEINKRRSYDAENGPEYEEKYRRNVIEGAIWRLGKIGAEGYASTSENGISVNWQEVPDWLGSVVPRLGVVR